MIRFVQPPGVDAQPVQGLAGHGAGDAVIRPDQCVVAGAAQQAVGNARRAAGANRHLAQPFALRLNSQDARGTVRHDFHVVVRVVIKAKNGTEPVAQWGADQGVPGRGSDQRKGIDAEIDAARRQALAHHPGEEEVLHRRVHHLLDGAVEAMDFVDEQHVVGLKTGQDRRNVAGPLDGRPGGDLDGRTHLVGDDVGQGGLAQARRPVDDHVIQGLAAHSRRLHGDAQVFPHLWLPHEVVQAGRPEADVLFAVVPLCRGGDRSSSERRRRSPVIALRRGGDRPCFGVCGAVRLLYRGHKRILGAASSGGQPTERRGCEASP